MTNEKTESEEIAEKLLPCPFPFTHFGELPDQQTHNPTCPAYYRPAVADAIEAAVAREREFWQHRDTLMVPEAVLDETQAEVERLQADLARLKAVHDPQGYRDLEIRIQELEYANRQLGYDIAAAEQRGREAEREECARHFERGAQFLSFRDEQVRYREIAATIRSRGTNSGAPKG